MRFRLPASCHVSALSSVLLSSQAGMQCSSPSNYKVESCGSVSDCVLIAVFDLAVSAQDLAHVAVKASSALFPSFRLKKDLCLREEKPFLAFWMVFM